jgi:hypothetical protein
MITVQRNDKVRGSFGVGIVTDAGDGFLIDQITGEPTGPVDSLVRILQYRNDKPVFKYTNLSEIYEVL